ncbi:hypothetical protein C8J57DRAFT_1677173 [Mycena rebaudengoi]|nr:hypothetical protein C8J57DRAFT_1677173 [Mycena rebaudengoi]
MPRIIPRLRELPLSGQFPFPAAKKKATLRKKVPPLPSVLPSDYPRSVLLSPGNIINNSRDYEQHKARAPAWRVSGVVSEEYDRTREMSKQERIWDSSPYRTQQPRLPPTCSHVYPSPSQSACSPVLCASACSLRDTLPADFMIRLAAKSVPPQPGSRFSPPALLPDGLEHPKFSPRQSPRGSYVLCWDQALAQVVSRRAFGFYFISVAAAHREPGKYKRIDKRVVAFPRLSEQIAHLLRLRVLQELDLLASQQEGRSRAIPRPQLVRRLTRAELASLASLSPSTPSPLSDPRALAILIVPPVNRDPTTKTRPPTADAIALSPAPPRPDPPHPTPRALPPLSVLHTVPAPPAPPPPTEITLEHTISAARRPKPWEAAAADRELAARYPVLGQLAVAGAWSPGWDARGQWGAGGAGDVVPEPAAVEVDVPPHAEARVPLYHGLTMFPGSVQRAKLHELLARLLRAERVARHAAGGRGDAKTSATTEKAGRAKGLDKGSHAFLIYSSSEVDVAPLGVALWRVRMWHGGGWKDRSKDTEEQEERYPWLPSTVL